METCESLTRRFGNPQNDSASIKNALGKQLANLRSDFDPRNYGYKKLSDMIRGTAGFDIQSGPGGHLRVRIASTGKPARKQPAKQKV